MQFHIDRDGKRLGPYTLEEINQSLKEGTLFPSDLVWEEGMKDWQPLDDLPGAELPGRESAPAKKSSPLKNALVAVLALAVVSGMAYGVWRIIGANRGNNQPADNNATADNKTADINATVDPSPPGTITLTGHASPITALAFSGNGAILISGDSGGGLKVWNVAGGAEIFSGQQTGRILDIRVHASGQIFAALSAGQVRYWNLATKSSPKQVEAKPPNLVGALDPNDAMFLARTTGGGALEAWEASFKRKLYAQTGAHSPTLTAITFSSSGVSLITGGKSGRVKIWQAQNGQLIHEITAHTNAVYAIAAHPVPAQPYFATGGEDRSLAVWQATPFKPLQRLTGHTGAIHCAAFNPADLLQIASGGGDRRLIIWNLKTGLAAYTIADHTGPINAIAYSPGGSRLATGSEDLTIKLRALGQ
jgi:WD40 repeat protein